MDPQACLQRIIDAAKANRLQEYINACEDLAGWLRRGGFAPKVPKRTRFIPGTHTPWAILDRAYDTDHRWALVRYREPYGKRVETLYLDAED